MRLHWQIFLVHSHSVSIFNPKPNLPLSPSLFHIIILMIIHLMRERERTPEKKEGGRERRKNERKRERASQCSGDEGEQGFYGDTLVLNGLFSFFSEKLTTPSKSGEIYLWYAFICIYSTLVFPLQNHHEKNSINIFSSPFQFNWYFLVPLIIFWIYHH